MKLLANTPFQKITGIILLIPAFISVILFILLFAGLHIDVLKSVGEERVLNTFWSGERAGPGAFSSTVPVYIGLMAIAGALLLRNDIQKP